MGKNKIKFYAIKKGRGVNNIIVDNWDRCAEYVLGFDAKYKSFTTLDDAENFLGISNPKKEFVKIKGIQDKFKVTVDETKLKELENKINDIPKQTRSGKRNKKKKNTETIMVDVPRALHTEFIKKCASLGMTEDMIIKSMIEEWLI